MSVLETSVRPVASAGRAVGRARMAARASAVLAGFFVLCVSVVCGAPGAQALAIPPAPIAIGETLAAGAAEVDAVGGAGIGGAACVASVICAGIVGTGLIGVGLYQTRDTWLPVVKGWIGGAFSTTGTAPASGCTMGVGGASLGAAGVTIPYSYAGCSGAYIGAAKLMLTNASWSCQTGDAVASGTAGTITLSWVGSSTSTGGSQNYNPCSAGQTLTNFAATANMTRGSTPETVGPPFSVGLAVDPAKVSQTTKVTCSDGAGNVLGVVTASGTGLPGQLELPSCSAVYAGSVPTHITATAGLPGAEGQTLMDSPLANPAAQYPDCFDSAGHYLASCVVRVWVNGAPCHVGTAGCGNWQTDAQDNPGDTVECRWGHYVVAMSDCDQLKRAYQPNTGTRTLTVTDPAGKPADVTDPGAVPQPSTPAQPTTGVNPTAPPRPAPVGSSTNPESTDCWGSGWSWNPISWVYVPTTCALKWAFVPAQTDLQTDSTNVTNTVQSTFPYKVIKGVQGAAGSTGYDSSCGGIPVDLNLGIQGKAEVPVHIDFLKACPGDPAAHAASITAAVLSSSLVVLTSFACIRVVAGGFGFDFKGALSGKAVEA